MIFWAWMLGVGSIVVLAGVWIHERLPRWRAADARARREPLTDGQFGERFFPPDLAPIAARVRRITSKQLDCDLTRLHPEDALAHVLSSEFDSLDTVELLMTIEDEFGIDLDDAAVTGLATFRDLVNAVAAKRPFLTPWRQQAGQAIERDFGVSLPREVLASVATPLDLAAAIAAALNDQVQPRASCQSQRAFYLLRSAMMRTLHLPRSHITPTTRLDRLIPCRTARSLWMPLRDALGARQWPSLIRPRWITGLVYGLPLLGGALAAFGLPALAEGAALHNGTLGFVMHVASEMRALVALAVIAGAWILLVRVSGRFCWAFPRNVRTVSDLVPFVLTSSTTTWTPPQIEEKVREILVRHLHVPIERYRADARFEEDLGLAAWTANTQTGSTRTEVSTYGHTSW